MSNQTWKEHNLLIVKYTELALSRGAISSCLNCDHWKKDEEKCGLYGATPPLKTIVTGCPSWEEMIPF